jgi:hypothetical protein
MPARLEQTPVKDPKGPADFLNQLLASTPDHPEIFNAATTLINQAPKQGSKPAEVRGWADKAFKAAEAYGPRWQRQVGTQLTESLLKQDDFSPIALEYARRTERLLEPGDPPDAQTRVLEALASALRTADKTDELKEVEQRLAKLEAQAYQQYLKTMPPFRVTPFAGRKATSDRAVLVELFTGAECPPCVAADVAFDAVEKVYKPGEAVLLQYHLHIPGPDPLTSLASEARQKYYGEAIEGTPTIFFNGKTGPQGGGPLGAAKERFEQYREVMDPLLETPAKVKLKVTAVRKGSKVEATTEVSDLGNPGERIKLRMALVEDVVRYRGGNGQLYHHRVVRAFLGKPEGWALAEKATKESASVELDALRKQLARHLQQTLEGNSFPTAPPLALRNLHVVAFVQNDETKEVLQAVQVPVGSDGVAAR